MRASAGCRGEREGQGLRLVRSRQRTSGSDGAWDKAKDHLGQRAGQEPHPCTARANPRVLEGQRFHQEPWTSQCFEGHPCSVGGQDVCISICSAAD